MTVSTVTVTIAAAMITGADLPRARVEFELTGVDINGAVIAPKSTSVTLDANGAGAIALWPNASGSQGTQYKVYIYDEGGALQFSGLATIPAINCNLHDVLNLASPAVPAVYPVTLPSAGQVLVGNAGGTAYAPKTVSGDGSLDSTGALSVTKVTGAAKTAPVDADSVVLVDSEAASVLKKLTWANVKATLKTYMDTLYQPLASALSSWASVTRASGFDTFAATPSSANLRSLLSDETGTGSAVFGTSPTISAPTLTGTTDLSGGQVKFPATQSASSDPNTLDDYEEGAFTPAITFGGGSTGLTYLTQSGTYTKVGRAVHVRLYVRVNAKGSSTGAALINGLPFLQESGVGFTSCDVIMIGAASLTEMPTAYIQAGTASVTLATGYGAITALTDANFAASTQVMVSGTYFV